MDFMQCNNLKLLLPYTQTLIWVTARVLAVCVVVYKDGFIEVEKLGYISSDTTADYLMIKAVAMIMSNNSLF